MFLFHVKFSGNKLFRVKRKWKFISSRIDGSMEITFTRANCVETLLLSQHYWLQHHSFIYPSELEKADDRMHFQRRLLLTTT